MKPSTLSIMLYLVRRWIVENIQAMFILLAIGGALAVFFLDPDTSATEELATAQYSYNAPGKFSAIDNILVAKLSDGRTINMVLPQGWVPPMAGNQIRVKRIRKLFFGERFVLLAAH